MSAGEIIVVAFPHPGHLFPAIELCLRLADRKCKITLIYPSSSPPPPSIHPLIHTVHLPIPNSIRLDPSLFDAALPGLLADLLADRRRRSSLPICAVVDEMIGWLTAPFVDSGVPAVSFFTSSAISSALDHAASDLAAPGPIPGLPDDVALTAFDFVGQQHSSTPHPFGPRLTRDGRPRRLRDIVSTVGAVGLIMNTCVDLERPFLNYAAQVARKPVWAVGPLLPARFRSAPVQDSFREGEVVSWLDSKPRGSVVYVSFGSLVGPSDAELEELAAGLEESGRWYVWALQPISRQHRPDGKPIETTGENKREYLTEGVKGRGMVIRGWAPQLKILGHPATGGYVCHCGWNSTMEAVVYGVPVLGWPVRGDQFHNAKLLVNQLKVGLLMRAAPGKAVDRADVVKGIERLMGDENIRKRAAALSAVFAGGLPDSSAAALDDFIEFLGADCGKK